MDRFLADRDQLLKGPYVSVAVPFHQGSGRNRFPQIPLPFPPYRHPEKAFQRLLPGSPVNTLVATGTGSGKTEAFLLPLLEHCREQRSQGQRGIRAILIDPMNALATDQARCIADLTLYPGTAADNGAWLDAEQQKETLKAIVEALCEAGLLQQLSGGRGERIWAIPAPRGHPGASSFLLSTLRQLRDEQQERSLLHVAAT